MTVLAEEAGVIPARVGQTLNEARGVESVRKYDRDCPRLSLERGCHRSCVCYNYFRLKIDQSFGYRSHPVNVTRGPTHVHPQVAALGPAGDRYLVQSGENGESRKRSRQLRRRPNVSEQVLEAQFRPGMFEKGSDTKVHVNEALRWHSSA